MKALFCPPALAFVIGALLALALVPLGNWLAALGVMQ
jgi:hypothetical protein